MYVPLPNLFHKPCFDQKPSWHSSELGRKSGIKPKDKSYASPQSHLRSSPGWGFHPASMGALDHFLKMRTFLRVCWDIYGSRLVADFALRMGFPSEMVEMPLLMVNNK